jgi:trimeric autotransporter adhesin
MNFKPKAAMFLFFLVQIFFASVLLFPSSVLAAAQTPSLSVNPSSITMTNPNYTAAIVVSQMQYLNTIHFVLSYNDRTLFLDVPTSGISVGDLFNGLQPTLTVGNYFLNSTGRSYLNVLLELPGSQTVSTTGTKNVTTITFNLLSNAMPGMQSGILLEAADALFFNGTNYDYVDERSGFSLQGGSLSVGYLTTSILATAAQTTVERLVNLSSTLKDGLGNPLSGLSVDYYIGSEKVGSGITGVNGISTVSYTPANVGTYSIRAQYSGNQPGGRYASSNSSASLLVTQVSTSLALSVPSSMKIGEMTTLAATLKKGVTPIGGSTINFSVLPPIGSWSTIGSAVTNSAGTAQVTYSFGTIGNFSIQAEFAGATNYAPCSDVTARTLSQSKTSMKLTITSTLTPKVDQALTLSSVLKDESGNSLSNKTVDYYVNSQKISSVTTDSAGASSVQYIPSGASSADGWKVEARFSGEAAFSSSVDSLQVVVSQIGTTISLNLSPSTITIEQKTTISITLKDEGGKPVPNANVDLYAEISGQSTKIGSITTDSNGVASQDYVPTVTGSLSIRANFTGSAKFVGSGSDKVALAVNKLETTLILNAPTGAKVGQQISISASLSDANQKEIVGASIEFSVVSSGIEQSVGSSKTDQSGIAVIPFTPTTVTTYQMKAKFSTDAKYLASGDSKTVPVALIKTSISISAQGKGKVGDSIPITAILTGENNTLIPGVAMDYWVDASGVSSSIGSEFTNSSSMSKRIFVPTAAGNYFLTAKYSGDSTYTAASKDITITISKVETALNVALSNSTVKNQKYVIITATLTDADQQPIEQANIEFQINQDGVWIPLNSATTNMLGVASSAYKTEKAGTLLVKAIFAGNTKYIGSTSTEKVLEVTEDSIMLTAFPYIIIGVVATAILIPLTLVFRRRKRNSLK